MDLILEAVSTKKTTRGECFYTYRLTTPSTTTASRSTSA